jgi:hypothetical protein
MNLLPSQFKRLPVSILKGSSLRTRAPLIITLILLISACSFKTLYNRLDYMIPSYVEGMVSLDDVLEEKVEKRAEGLISWHRNTQLVQYADLLRTFQQDIESPLDRQRVLQHITTMQQLWESLENEINEEMAELLPLLNAEQREELFDSIEDKNEDFYDEYVDIDDDERIEQFTDTTVDNFESWLGYITTAQETAIEQAMPGLANSAALRLEQRRLWQSSIRQILDSTDSKEIKTDRLRQFFDGFSMDNQPQLAAASDKNIKIYAQLTADIVNQATTEQRTFFKDKTDEYIRIFTELSENR